MSSIADFGSAVRVQHHEIMRVWMGLHGFRGQGLRVQGLGVEVFGGVDGRRGSDVLRSVGIRAEHPAQKGYCKGIPTSNPYRPKA